MSNDCRLYLITPPKFEAKSFAEVLKRALGAGDVEHAGALMLRNHELLAQLGVSTPGLDRAVELLSGLPGVHGAKLTGAGGGGAMIALVDADQRPALHELLAQKFALVLPFDLGGER